MSHEHAARAIVRSYIRTRARVEDVDYINPYAYISNAPSELMTDAARMRRWLARNEPNLLHSEEEAEGAARSRVKVELTARAREEDPKAKLSWVALAEHID